MELKKEDLEYYISQGAKLFPVILIVVISVLMLPDSIASKIGVQSIRNAYLGWFVLAAVVSFLLWSSERVDRLIERRTMRRNVRERAVQFEEPSIVDQER